MDPERWSQITRTFAVERGEERNYANCDTKVGENENNSFQNENMDVLLRDIATNSSSLSEENVKIIYTLKEIVKEKVERIKQQEEIISSLRNKIEEYERKEASSSVDVEIVSQPESSIPLNRLSDGTASPTSATQKSSSIPSALPGNSDDDREIVVVKRKLEGLEQRLDVLLTCVQSQLPKFPVDSCNYANETGKNGGVGVIGPPPAHMKPWYKSPTLRPKPTSGSILREAYCRNRSLASKITANGESNGQGKASSTPCGLGEKITYPGTYGTDQLDQDVYNPHVIEQRLQFLETLVLQMKTKFMKLIALHYQRRK